MKRQRPRCGAGTWSGTVYIPPNITSRHPSGSVSNPPCRGLRSRDLVLVEFPREISKTTPAPRPAPARDGSPEWALTLVGEVEVLQIGNVITAPANVEHDDRCGVAVGQRGQAPQPQDSLRPGQHRSGYVHRQSI